MNTPIVGVSHIARGTEFTDGLMVLHYTGSVAGADLALAGVGALEVDAGLVPGAAPVLQTDGDRGGTARGADTEGFVLQHLTLLAHPAQPGLVAGVDTAARLTGLVTGTLRVSPTLQLSVRTGEVPGLAHHQAVLAPTDGLVGGHLALLVAVAGEPRTGVDTLPGLSVAGGRDGAALVSLTAQVGLRQGVGGAGGVRPAGNVRSASVALRTLAPGLVHHHRTDGILATGSSEAAGVNTTASPAGLSDGTIEISSALSVYIISYIINRSGRHSFTRKIKRNKEKCQLTRVRDTFDERISVRFVSWADTEGSGRVDNTESSLATGGGKAGVNERSATDTARVTVSGTSRGTLATVATDQVLTDGVGSAGT